jgi:hypothetical protein
MPDLLTVLHDIDRFRGKTCGAYIPIGPATMRNDPRMCLIGYGPADADDGCDDFAVRAALLAEVAR